MERPGWRRRAETRTRDRTGGFTLVELLVVLVILSMIMGLVGPRVLSYLTDARARSAKLQIGNLAASLDLFLLDVGRYPLKGEGLQALVERPVNLRGWNGPYLAQERLPLDPWGNAYEYRAPDQAGRYEIVSLGADGRRGGANEAADIANR